MNGHPLANNLPLVRWRDRLTAREVLFVSWGGMLLVMLFLLRFGLWMPVSKIRTLQAERARLTLEERVAQRAADKQAELAIQVDEIARQVNVYRRASFPGLTGGQAALRFLSELEEIAGKSGIVLASKTARSQAGANDIVAVGVGTTRASSEWETLNAELVVHGPASRIFGFLRGAAARFPQARLDNLVLTRAQDGASWEARVTLALARPVPVAGLPLATKAESFAFADPPAEADNSLSNLLSARAFGERPAPPLAAKRVAVKPAAAASAPMKSGYKLLGFAGDETRARAVLCESETGKTVIVGVGDTAGGERILAIGRRGVDVALPDGSRQTLPLP